MAALLYLILTIFPIVRLPLFYVDHLDSSVVPLLQLLIADAASWIMSFWLIIVVIFILPVLFERGALLLLAAVSDFLGGSLVGFSCRVVAVWCVFRLLLFLWVLSGSDLVGDRVRFFIWALLISIIFLVLFDTEIWVHIFNSVYNNIKNSVDTNI